MTEPTTLTMNGLEFSPYYGCPWCHEETGESVPTWRAFLPSGNVIHITSDGAMEAIIMSGDSYNYRGLRLQLIGEKPCADRLRRHGWFTWDLDEAARTQVRYHGGSLVVTR